MKKLSLLLLLVLMSGFASANSPPPLDLKAITETIILSQALVQGDAESLKKAKAQFTEVGLRRLEGQLIGFIDEKGAPTFSQTFTPLRELSVTRIEGGVIKANLLGTQKQTSGTSTTTYNGIIEIELDEKTLKIMRSNFQNMS